jgi:predicted Fe-Mo cluster-binding NifX family protein
MKIAIPIYGDYVSNVFDFAHRLLLVDIKDGREIKRSEVEVNSQSLPQRASQLQALGVNLLVCGAISQLLANMVMQSGIEILPYVTGKFNIVIQAYMSGQLLKQEFIMPGYWPGARKGFGRHRRGCRWRGGK